MSKKIVVDNKLYEIKTINILSILSLLEESLITDNADQHYKNIYNAISLTKEIIQDEMNNQTPIELTETFEG
jgi:hypothetical protein